MMNVLVTGGAGYIGSHVVMVLKENGFRPIILDDLSSGFEEFVPDGIPFVRADVRDVNTLIDVMRSFSVRAVIHMAAYKHAGESVKRPISTWGQNLENTRSVLRAMDVVSVPYLIFSSSAAVYGDPQTDIVSEYHETKPTTPYGSSKLAAERLINEVVDSSEMKAVSLRYFNVVGSGYTHLYDASPHNLFPIVFQRLIDKNVPSIFGDEYKTPDGTCIRDYVNVKNVAEAHVAALVRMAGGRPTLSAYNLGTGIGTSVRDVMAEISHVTGIQFEPIVEPRRPGDPARIVAGGSLAARDLGWQLEDNILDSISTAWKAFRHPKYR